MDVYNVVAVVASLFALLVYHVYLYFGVCCAGDSWVQLSTNIKNSHYWMMKHSEQVCMFLMMISVL